MSQEVWVQEVWALVLGGGDPGDPFAAAHGVSVKPLIPIAGQPMGQWVLQALRQSGQVGRVAYVGPLQDETETQGSAMASLVDVRVTDRGSLLGNLEAGIAALYGPATATAPQPRLLVVTADVPMLKGTEVADLLRQAPEAALVYPIVNKEVCQAAYPEVKRTYARLKDGTFTGGNLFLLDPSLVSKFLPRLREVLSARKAPLRLAAMIGPGTLLKLLLGRLSIAELEGKISHLLGVKASALITPYAAVGTDVDKESDLALAQHELS